MLNGISCRICRLVQKLSNMSHLTVAQRYQIETMHQLGHSQKEIALHIDRHKSVVCRELKRNCDQRNQTYKAELAQRKYTRRLVSKPKLIRFTEAVKQHVNDQIEKDYSPEQIVGSANKKGIACVSAERIYQYIWEDKKQGGTLYKRLRTKGKRYRKRGALKDSRGIIPGRIDISQRPQIVEDKTRFGDLEVDTVIGANHKGALVTINDRSTGMVKIRIVKSKEAHAVEIAIVDALQEWKPLLSTMTSDNGKEFARHQTISEKLEIDFYFAKPYCSWERGANENLNGLIRQYFPKKISFEAITEHDVQLVETILNNRPRKRYNFETPLNMFNQKVAFVT